MKSLVKFITESKGGSRVDKILKQIKNMNTTAMSAVMYAVENYGEKNYGVSSPITFTVLSNQKAVIFSFICKNEKLLRELVDKIGVELKVSKDPDDGGVYMSFKITDDPYETSKIVLDFITKNLNNFQFFNTVRAFMEEDDAWDYKESKTAFEEKSYEDQIKAIDDQIKGLEEQKEHLKKLYDFVNEEVK